MMESNNGTYEGIAADRISIIVPVYNVDAYLPACVESILAQTYTNWELILIDDGSRDDSGRLCDQYAEGDSRIRVHHQMNQGVAAARTQGLSMVQGDYVAFIDSDDLVKPDYLEVMLGLMETHDVDLVCVNAVSPNDQVQTHDLVKLVQKPRRVEDVNDYFCDIARNEEIYTTCIWGKLYKTELVKNRKFPPMRYGEDVTYLCQVLAEGPKAYLDTYEGYYYVFREGSTITASGFHNLARQKDEVRMDAYRWSVFPKNLEEAYKSMMLEQYAARIHNLAYSSVVQNSCEYDDFLDEHAAAVMEYASLLGFRLRIFMELIHRFRGIYCLMVRAKYVLRSKQK